MEPGEGFDQTRFELTPDPRATSEDPSPPELFADDFSQPEAAESEPVFWNARATGDLPENDFVQPDALD